MSKIDELIADGLCHTPIEPDGRHTNHYKLAAAMKVAMDALQCEWPNRENPCRCAHCATRSEIDAIAEGVP